jgi:hypothetical protein
MKTISVRTALLTVSFLGFLLLGRTDATARASDGSFEQQAISAERQGLEALKAGDREQFGKLTADEAILVDSHGPVNKAQLMKNIAGFTLTDYSMEDVKFMAMSADTGLISYKLTEKGAFNGREFSAQAYVSSVWRTRGGKWECLFSQETGIPKRPAPAA